MLKYIHLLTYKWGICMRLPRFRTLQNKMIFVIMVFMVLPMTILSHVTAVKTEQIYKQKVEELTSSALDQLNSSFQQVIDSIITTTNVIVMDEDIISTLKYNGSRDEYDLYQKQKRITEKLNSALGIILRYHCNLTIIDNYGDVYSTWNRTSTYDYNKYFYTAHWYRETIKRDGRLLWIVPHENYTLDEGQNKSFISLARVIKGDKGTGGYGVLLISLYIHEVENLLRAGESDGNGNILILDEKGRIILNSGFISDSDKEEFEKHIADNAYENGNSFTLHFKNQNLQIVSRQMKNVNWKSLYVIPYDEMLKEVKTMELTNRILGLMVMVAFTLVSVFIAFTVSKPIRKLMVQMDKVKNGNLDIHISADAPDEVGRLTDNFNMMMDNIRKLMGRIAEEEKEKQEAHLEALKAQINPHFLFNTLNAIKWSAYVNGARKEGDMLATLGRLLELAMNKKSEFITVADEIEYVKNYIVLMNIRYNQEISAKYEVDESIVGLYTLNFILQPIVENAIIHGLGNKPERAELLIKAGKADGWVIYSVSDNGKGIPAEQLDKILRQKKNRDRRRFTGIGLSNIIGRLKLHFGEEYRFDIESVENRGTTVTIGFPASESVKKAERKEL